MQIKPLRKDLADYLRKHQLTKKFDKQAQLFLQNPRHPSLHTELIEPKVLKIYSFRIDKQYRAIFLFSTKDQVEIVDINNHYR